MEKQITKFLFLILLLATLLCQKNIETKEFAIYKDKNTTNIDISEHINNMNGTYSIELANISDLHFNREKKIIIQNCELEFHISSLIDSKKINVKMCSNNLEINNKIFINDKNTFISFDHDKFNLLTGLFTFWVTGVYNEKKTDYEKNNDGVLREWYENGDQFIEYNYNNGKRHGSQKRWNENGTLSIHYYFLNGKLNGEQKSWHKNGNLQSLIYYKDDNIDGLYKEWYSNGQIKIIKFYIKGNLKNVLESYDINGKTNLNDF